MLILGRYIIILLLVITMSGCASRQVITKAPITLPKRPKVVVMDSGKYDKDKYPETKWIKPPKQDLKKGRASWSFKDIEKISEALTEWPRWADDVEEIVGEHNKAVEASKDFSTSWWKFWK